MNTFSIISALVLGGLLGFLICMFTLTRRAVQGWKDALDGWSETIEFLKGVEKNLEEKSK